MSRYAYCPPDAPEGAELKAIVDPRSGKAITEINGQCGPATPDSWLAARHILPVHPLPVPDGGLKRDTRIVKQGGVPVEVGTVLTAKQLADETAATEQAHLEAQAEAMRDQLEMLLAMWGGMMEQFGLPEPPSQGTTEEQVMQAVGMLRAKRQELSDALAKAIKDDARGMSAATAAAVDDAQAKYSNYEGAKQELMFFFGDMQKAAEAWQLKDYLK